MLLKNKEEVIKYFRLGTIFYKGDFVDQNFEEAQKYFKLGWELDDPRSGFNYAKMLASGRGGKKDIQKAIDVFKKVAGYIPDAYYELSKIHDKENMISIGTSKGSRKCIIEYAKTIEQNYEKRAMNFYDLASRACLDVEYDDTKLESIKLLSILMFKNGEHGAMEKLVYCAERGLEECRYYIGMIYLEKGEKLKAFQEFRKASMIGHEESIFEYINLKLDHSLFIHIDQKTIRDFKVLYHSTKNITLKHKIGNRFGDYYRDLEKPWEAYEWYSDVSNTTEILKIFQRELEKILGLYEQKIYTKLFMRLENIFSRIDHNSEIHDIVCYWKGIFLENGIDCTPDKDKAEYFFTTGSGFSGCRYKLAEICYLLQRNISKAIDHCDAIISDTSDQEWISKAKDLKMEIEIYNNPEKLEETYNDSEENIVYGTEEEYVQIDYKPNFIMNVEKLYDGEENSPDNIYLLGYMYMKNGDVSSAKEKFKQSARMGHRDSLIKLGELSLEE